MRDDDGGEGGASGSGCDVELNVIGIKVKPEAMITDYVSKGEHGEDKQEGTEHRTLGDALREKFRFFFCSQNFTKNTYLNSLF